MPAPPADSTPMARIKPAVVVISGVMKVPSATSSTPTNSTRPAPTLSAIAPANGCVSPHQSCPKANARLMLAQPQAGGRVQRAQEQAPWSAACPSSARRCRPPASRTSQMLHCTATRVAGLTHGRLQLTSRPAIRATRRSARAMPARDRRPGAGSTPPAQRFQWRCASARLSRPASVMVTRRLRPSAPEPSATQPAAINGLRLRVRVEASIVIACARSPGRIGPSLSTCDSSEYCVVFSPALASSRS